MNPQDQLTADLKAAMKGGDTLRRDVIRGVLAAFKEAEQRKRETLTAKALEKHAVRRPELSMESARTEEERARAAEAVRAYDWAVGEALKAEQVGARTALDEPEALAIIQKLVKQREDSIAEAQKAGRDDIVQSEQAELDILQSYLPKQFTREEIEREARAVIAEIGVTDPREMGQVMRPLMERMKGRADGKLVSEVVRAILAE